MKFCLENNLIKATTQTWGLKYQQMNYLIFKKMKSGKSAGIDGISADFLKVFWNKLKVLVTKAIKFCYNKGPLSTSLRQSIITCLRKGNKDRSCLKNWRPISLLCIVYKMASAVIAERIKPYLNKFISRSQTGYLSGRYIGESTGLFMIQCTM